MNYSALELNKGQDRSLLELESLKMNYSALKLIYGAVVTHKQRATKKREHCKRERLRSLEALGPRYAERSGDYDSYALALMRKRT